jgi:serine/threonine protein kinase
MLKESENFSLFAEEVEALKRIKHKCVIDLISSGTGKLICEMDKNKIVVGEYVALELLSDWSTSLNYYSIQEHIIRKIFKRILKTVIFIQSKSVPLKNLAFNDIKCNKQGVIKINPSFVSKSLSAVHDTVSVTLEYSMSVMNSLGMMLLKMWFGTKLGEIAYTSGALSDFQCNMFWTHLETLSFSRISYIFKDLLKSILSKNRSRSLNFSQILLHPWVMNEVYEDELDDCMTK